MSAHTAVTARIRTAGDVLSSMLTSPESGFSPASVNLRAAIITTAMPPNTSQSTILLFSEPYLSCRGIRMQDDRYIDLATEFGLVTLGQDSLEDVLNNLDDPMTGMLLNFMKVSGYLEKEIDENLTVDDLRQAFINLYMAKEVKDNRYTKLDDWTIPDEFEKTVPQVFPTTAPGNFSWCEEAHKVVMTTFYPYQWDLNYANPIVFNDMTENMLYLCNQGVDIIRLDAVPYIWKELGTNCRNLPQVHSLVRMMHMASDIVCPGTLLLGEVVMEPSKVVPYFGTVEKPECHMLYNVTTMASTWHTVATKDVRLLQYQLSQVFALPKEYTFLNYLRCHDDIGWGLDYGFLSRFGMGEVPHKKFLNDCLTGRLPGSPSRGELYNDDPRLGDARLCGTTASLCGVEAARYEKDDEKLAWALRLDISLHAYMFTLSGIPVLYSGDEIAQENDYTYHDDPDKAADSRYLHRGNMNWEAAKLRHDPATPEGQIFTALRAALETLRDAHRVFDSRADVWLLRTGDNAVLGIGRYHQGEKLLALFNFAETERRVSIDELGEFRDLLTGQAVDKWNLTLLPGGFLWLLCDFGEENGKQGS